MLPTLLDYLLGVSVGQVTIFGVRKTSASKRVLGTRRVAMGVRNPVKKLLSMARDMLHSGGERKGARGERG